MDQWSRYVQKSESYILERSFDLNGYSSIGYSKLEHDDSSMVTWSAAVILSLTMTPRIRRLVTRSIPGHGGGGIRFFVKKISFVLSRLSLLSRQYTGWSKKEATIYHIMQQIVLA